MLYPVLGLAGHFTAWCRVVVYELAKPLGRVEDAENLPGGLADIGKSLLSSGADHLVFSAGRPDLELVASIRESGRAFLYPVADPRRAVLHMIKVGKLDHLLAVRLLSGDCSCLAGLVDAPNCVRLELRDALQDPVGAIWKIATAFNIEASDAEVRSVLAKTRDILTKAVDPEEGGDDPRSALIEECGETLGASIDYLMSGFEPALLGEPNASLIITRDFFLAGDPPHDHVTTPLDMTGRARFLVFGPYMHIPAGDWSVRFVVAFSSEAQGTLCAVDIGASDGPAYHELGRSSFTISAKGRMEITMNFEHKDPLTSIQVRLATEKAVFDGKIAVGFAEFRKRLPQADEDLNQLSDFSQS